MNEQQLSQIERRASQATPGPWRASFLHDCIFGPAGMIVGESASGHLSQADARFIAASREDVPALIHEVRVAHCLVRNLAALMIAQGQQPNAPGARSLLDAGIVGALCPACLRTAFGRDGRDAFGRIVHRPSCALQEAQGAICSWGRPDV